MRKAAGLCTVFSLFAGLAAGAPSVVVMTPQWGLSDGDTRVIITGIGLDEVVSVQFDGYDAAEVTHLSTSAIEVVTPWHPVGSASVWLNIPDGDSVLAGSFDFRDTEVPDAAGCYGGGGGDGEGEGETPSEPQIPDDVSPQDGTGGSCGEATIYHSSEKALVERKIVCCLWSAASRAPIIDATLSLEPAAGPPASGSADGNYFLTISDPGTYILTVSTPDFGECRYTVTMEAYEAMVVVALGMGGSTEGKGAADSVAPGGSRERHLGGDASVVMTLLIFLCRPAIGGIRSRRRQPEAR